MEHILKRFIQSIAAPYILAAISTLGLSANFGASSVLEVWPDVSLFWALLYFAIAWLYRLKFQDLGLLHSPIWQLAAFYAFLNSLGTVVAYQSDGKAGWLLSISLFVLLIVGLTPLFCIGVRWIWDSLDSLSRGEGESGTEDSRPAKASFVLTLKTALLYIASWAPLFLIMLPGNVCNDYINQLSQFYGASALTNHHPVLSTVYFGVLHEIGWLLGGDSMSIILSTAVQIVVLAFIFALCYSCLVRMGLAKRAQVICLALWALLPPFMIYAQWLVKDVLSAALFLLVVLQGILRLWASSRNVEMRRLYSWPAMMLVGLLCSLSRNNCLYVVLPWMVAVAVFSRSGIRVGLLSSVGMLSLYLIWNMGVLPALNITAGSQAEALSLPLQQTARYLVEHPDDVTQDEERVLRELFGDERYESMDEYYRESISDDVKRDVSFSNDGISLLEYLKVWASQGLRHPVTYLVSALQSTIGYWYPSYWERESVQVWNTPWSSVNSHYFAYWEEIGHDTTPQSPWQGLREIVVKGIKFVSDLPVINLLFKPAFYVWVALLLCTYLILHRSFAAPVAMPLLLTWGICCLSPLNNSIRYVLPIIVTIPLLVGMVSLNSSEKQEFEGDDSAKGRINPLGNITNSAAD